MPTPTGKIIYYSKKGEEDPTIDPDFIMWQPNKVDGCSYKKHDDYNWKNGDKLKDPFDEDPPNAVKGGGRVFLILDQTVAWMKVFEY